MRKLSAVIGANYGDEGKGLATDFLSNKNTLVVRYNSGAQAGHTVVAPDGSRHVFHHFGSGTLRGASTFLSEHFAVHPMFFGRELQELRKLGVRPEVYIDPYAPITTPYDVMINQAVEMSRGNGRHGSCGMGFNETINRSTTSKLFKIDFLDIQFGSEYKTKLRDILKYYVPMRLEELKLPKDSLPHLDDERIMDRFIRDSEFVAMNAKTTMWKVISLLWKDDILFEGAQGLLLDMNSRDFPHVTRSKTGLHNVVTLMEQADFKEELHAHYISRTYLTRHGAGPMPHEMKSGLPYSRVKDETNVYNPHQEHLRFGYLSKHRLISEITQDLRNARNVKVVPNLFLTCVDQLERDEYINYFDENGVLCVQYYKEFGSSILNKIEGKSTFFSGGNTREYVFT